MTRWVVLLLFWVGAGCYEQPLIPRDKPIRCGAMEPRCPAGLVCVAEVCAPEACLSDLECPQGLVCGPRGDCDLPSAGGLDAGSDGAVDGAGADGNLGAPDAPAADAPGGSDAPADAPSGPDSLVLTADAGGDL